VSPFPHPVCHPLRRNLSPFRCRACHPLALESPTRTTPFAGRPFVALFFRAQKGTREGKSACFWMWGLNRCFPVRTGRTTYGKLTASAACAITRSSSSAAGYALRR
jgi:hypothetical protein